MKDVIGEVWGRLTIIADAGKTERRIKLVKCRCSCSNHNEIIVQYNSLKRGLTKSCGCLRKIKYVNKRNGRLLVVAETYKSNNGPVAGLYCQCDCGNRYYS
jgi:hypothetical protein